MCGLDTTLRKHSVAMSAFTSGTQTHPSACTKHIWRPTGAEHRDKERMSFFTLASYAVTMDSKYHHLVMLPRIWNLTLSNGL